MQTWGERGRMGSWEEGRGVWGISRKGTRSAGERGGWAEGIREWSSMTEWGGGVQKGRGGGAREVLPQQKGGVAEKVLAMLKGGHDKCWGSFNMGA